MENLEQMYRDILSTTPLPAAWYSYTEREKDIYRHALNMATEHTSQLFVRRVKELLQRAESVAN